MECKVLKDIAIESRRVMIREDLNVPVRDGVVTSDVRIRAALPTLRYALDQGARITLLSHLGRPEEGVPISQQLEASLAPVAQRLTELLGVEVPLVPDLESLAACQDRPIVLLENVRVLTGEKSNDEQLSRRLASHCDVFVMDAFATAHRAQASTHGVARYAPIACAGPLLAGELEALERALLRPASPVVAIVGGSKVSTKLEVLTQLARRVDHLVVGGGIANTFLAAAGHEIGKSLSEPDLVETARRLLDSASLPLPVDVVVTDQVGPDGKAELRRLEEITPSDIIVDIGPETSARYGDLLRNAGTIIWNGPVGVFEIDQFGAGTRAVAEAVAGSPGFSIAGGGDTLAAIEKYGLEAQISYISTGGGAFLEYVEGKELPAVAILEERGRD